MQYVCRTRVHVLHTRFSIAKLGYEEQMTPNIELLMVTHTGAFSRYTWRLRITLGCGD
jgi:hypothetical protein